MSTNTTPTLPETGFLRLKEVLRFLPFCKTKWYAGVKNGEFPQPVKFGRMSLYKVEDIRALIERLGKGDAA